MIQKVDSVFVLPGLFSNVEAVLSSLSLSLFPRPRRREGRGKMRRENLRPDQKGTAIRRLAEVLSSLLSGGSKFSMSGQTSCLFLYLRPLIRIWESLRKVSSYFLSPPVNCFLLITAPKRRKRKYERWTGKQFSRKKNPERNEDGYETTDRRLHWQVRRDFCWTGGCTLTSGCLEDPCILCPVWQKPSRLNRLTPRNKKGKGIINKK